MSESDKVFSGSIPELYDTYLVPLIFEAYANDLAERATTLVPKTVLETAAGSGVVTRAMASRLASDARYIVTDLNQAMLDHAASKQGSDDRITWRQADALNLPFDDATFDAVVCQFGVMFFLTGSPVMPRRGGCSNRAAASSSTSGIILPRTSSPMSWRRRRPLYSPMTRRVFSLEPRTGTMTWILFARNWVRPDFRKSPLPRWRKPVPRRRRVIPPSHIVRARHCATRLKPGTQAFSSTSPIERRTPSRRASVTAPYPEKFEAISWRRRADISVEPCSPGTRMSLLG